MSTIRVSLNINAPADQVFQVIGDFFGIGRFHPYITTVDKAVDKGDGVGSVRICHFKDGTQVTETIKEWHQGSGYKVELSGYSFPLKYAFAEFSVLPGESSNTSVAAMVIRYQVKYGPLGALMNLLMIRPLLKKRLSDVLTGLENEVRKTDAVPSMA